MSPGAPFVASGKPTAFQRVTGAWPPRREETSPPSLGMVVGQGLPSLLSQPPVPAVLQVAALVPGRALPEVLLMHAQLRSPESETSELPGRIRACGSPRLQQGALGIGSGEARCCKQLRNPGKGWEKWVSREGWLRGGREGEKLTPLPLSGHLERSPLLRSCVRPDGCPEGCQAACG